MYRINADDPEIGRISLLWPDERTGPWWVVLRWSMSSDSGRPECVGVDLRSCREDGEAWPPSLPMWSESPPMLTQKVWRSLPIMKMIRDVRRYLNQVEADVIEQIADDADLVDEDRRLQLRQELLDLQQHLAGGNALPGSAYEEVAHVYRQAWHEGRPPTKAVAAHFTISESAAGKRVMRARRAGLLPPTPKGVAGLGRKDTRS